MILSTEFSHDPQINRQLHRTGKKEPLLGRSEKFDFIIKKLQRILEKEEKRRAHSGKHRLDENQYFIDNFSSKQTTAWRDLLEYRSPIIFPRGSECNEFISIADMFAYLTEKKLWDNKLWLRPENIEKVWKDYDFFVETRFIDEAVLSKIRWYSKEEIPTADYLARPMVFMDIEGISVSRLSKDPLASAAAYACSLGGGLEAFDPYIDSDKIRDGDVYVYAGKEAEKRADSFKDMFEIETLSVKELRRKAQQLLK